MSNRNGKKLPLSIDLNSRRMFLKGSGAALAIPFLPSLLTSREAEAATPLPNIVFTGSTHGRWNGSWYPGGVTLDQVAPNVRSKSLASINGPLGRVFNRNFDDLRSKINILQGLDFCTTSGHDNILYSAANRIHYRDGVWKNFTPVFPYTADVILSKSASFYPVKPAIDVLRIAPRHEGGFPTGVIGLDGATPDGNGNFLPRYGDSISRVYNYLNAYFDPTKLARISRQLPTKRFLVDSVLSEFKSLATSSRLSAKDRGSLSNYVDHLNDVQRSLASYAPPTNSCGPLPVYDEPTDNEVFNERLIDLMVLAMKCGITRVATYDLNWDACAQKFGGADFHGPAGVHGCNNGQNYENIANWTESFAKYFAMIARKMDQQGILDSSLVIYGNEMSSSVPNHHGLDIPVLTAGSLGGKLRTGEYMSFQNMGKKLGDVYGQIQNADLSMFTGSLPLYGGRPFNELMTTMFAAVGVPPSEYQRDGKVGFGAYGGCQMPDGSKVACGNGESDSWVSYRMGEYYSKDYKESRLATLPYFFKGT